MIEVVLVVQDDEMGKGMQRLLEQDGDVRVVGRVATVEEANAWDDALVVVGPGMIDAPDEFVWVSVSQRRLILLTSRVARAERCDGVIEVALELTGESLRTAVREAAAKPSGS